MTSCRGGWRSSGGTDLDIGFQALGEPPGIISHYVTVQLDEILRTWLGPMPAADDMQALSNAVPDLDARLLTPSRWLART